MTYKFDNRGSADGGNWCPQRTDAVGDFVKKSQPTGGNRGDDDSDADEWGERREATKFRVKVRDLVAKSHHFNKNVDAIPVFASPESAKAQHSPGLCDCSGGFWYNWNQEPVDSNRINWRDEINTAAFDEGSLLPQDVYLNARIDAGKLPRDMTKEEVQDNWQGVSKAKVKEISGLYELGCFERWFRYKSNNKYVRITCLAIG